MSPAYAEQRRYPRLSDPPVFGRLSVRSEARVVDISEGGACLEGERALPFSQRFQVTIPAGERRLKLSGRAVWNRLARTSPTPDGEVEPVYRGGVSFEEEVDPEASRSFELGRFIAGHALEAKREGQQARYVLRPDVGQVEVEAWHDFRVRSISASGMLVETERLIDAPPHLEIQLRLPWVPLMLRGRLVRAERKLDERRRPFTRLAIEFEEISEEARQHIESLVAEGLRRDPPLDGTPEGTVH